jgi:leader peptidase (prepilin peptidase)/N-methyltransferase
MNVVVMAIFGTVMWMVAWRPTERFVDRSRVDVAIWTVVSAVLGGLIGWRFDVGLLAITACTLAVGLVVLTEIDLRTRRLPREISYPLFGSVLTLVGVVSWVGEGDGRIIQTVLGATVATIVLSILHWSSRGQLGDGDVRLAPALGTVASFGGVSAVWTSLLVAFVAAGAFVIVLMVSGRATRTTTVPFGPFLAGGAIVTVLVTGV